MKMIVALTAAILTFRVTVVAAKPRRVAFLRLNEYPDVEDRPDTFEGEDAELNVVGFCALEGCDSQGKDAEGKPCASACEPKQPCCCWSSFANEQHPSYPDPFEVRSNQKCVNPPEGFDYAPEPGLSYDSGVLETLKRSGEPTYDDRKLCCLRRHDGVQHESQYDLRDAVPTPTTTPATTTESAILLPPEPGQVDAAFATEAPPTTSLMNPGEEYENAQMEEAARAHLDTAHELMDATHALETSTDALADVDNKMQSDPDLIRSRRNVAKMKAAVHNWAVRRWANLKRLKSGDASAFDDAPRLASAPAPAAGL